MSNTRRYKVTGNFSIDKLAAALENFLISKNLQSQTISNKGFIHVQARESYNGRSVFALDATAQVDISYKNDILVATVGSGNWFIKRGTVTIIGYVFFLPLEVTSLITPYSQLSFNDEVFGFIRKYLSSNGKV